MRKRNDLMLCYRHFHTFTSKDVNPVAWLVSAPMNAVPQTNLWNAIESTLREGE